MNVIYVFYRDGKVKCLGDEHDKTNHNALIADGWKHAATLNARVFIENTINQYPELIVAFSKV